MPRNEVEKMQEQELKGIVFDESLSELKGFIFPDGTIV
jgi:hypothetical protein